MKGVGFLGNEIKRSRVIYGRVADPSVLQEMADRTVQAFVDNKLMEKERNHVTLHATLMNSTFSWRHFESNKFNRDRSSRPAKPSRTFDASHILEAYKDHEFTDAIPIQELHISCFSGVTPDGFYLPLYKLNLDD